METRFFNEGSTRIHTFGADPEVFLVDKLGKFVSAHDLLPGTKENPHPVPFGAIQVDGVAFEFNIDPASSAMEFIGNIKKVMKTGENMVKEGRSDLEIKISPTATFDPEYFRDLPDEPKLLGCTPDYNAYTEEENTPPSTDEPFRTGSFHLHVGWRSDVKDTEYPDHWKECVSYVKQLDAVLFPTSMLWDSDEKRRSLYGKIGAFRPKRYGVEYRPMSNMVLSSVLIQKFVFDAASRASDLLANMKIKIYEDDFAEQMIRDFQDNRAVSKDDIRYYNRYLNEKYAIPLFL